MALDSNKTGDSIAAFVQSVAPAPGSPVTTDQLKILWEGIMNIIYTDLKSDALVTGPGTGLVTSGPGSGGNVTTQLVTGKIN